MSTVFHGTSLGHLSTTKRGFNTAKLRTRLSAVEAPAVVSARGYLRNGMPAIYQDGDFGLRFLESLETLLDPIVGTLDVLHRYFHPSLAPRDVLDLLAAWLGLDVDESWADERLRDALSREGEISRRRGTRPGLQLALEIAFPKIPLRVEDSGGVTWSTNPTSTAKAPPPAFIVYCDTPIPEQTQLAIARVIEKIKPVHVTYRLRVKAPKKPAAS
ncbi:MAG TPA: phage tail protein [Gaiellaceae bacterium]|jgi:phage tail-like protein